MYAFEINCTISNLLFVNTSSSGLAALMAELIFLLEVVKNLPEEMNAVPK